MQEYSRTVNGVEMTFQLTEEDAKAQGFTEPKRAETKAAQQPLNKARTVENK